MHPTIFLLATLLTLPLSLQSVVNGDLVSCKDANTVYYLAEDGSRWVFPNEKTYNTWFDDFSTVQTIPCTQLTTYPIGSVIPYQAGIRLLKIPSSPKVYAVLPGGELRWITSSALAESLYGSNWATYVDDLPEGFFSAYQEGPNLTSANIFPEGMIVRDESGTFYRNALSLLRQIPPSAVTRLMQQNAPVRTRASLLTQITTMYDAETWRATQRLDQHASVTSPSVLIAPTLLASNAEPLVNDSYSISWKNLYPKDDTVTYHLQESTSPHFSQPHLVQKSSKTSASFQKTPPANTYYYRVKTVAKNEESAWSKTVIVHVKRYQLIPGLQDENIPIIDILDTMDTSNTSVPLALATVISWWDTVINDENAVGVTASLPVRSLAAYLAFFLDTNNNGSTARTNQTDKPLGTVKADIVPGIHEFFAWDGSTTATTFPVPSRAIKKSNATNWHVVQQYSTTLSNSQLFRQIKSEINAGRPMVVVFDYWNPVSENASFHDIDLYTWGPSISDALDAELVGTNLGVVPNETWVYHGTNRDIGHGATIIGYIPDYSLTGETDDEQDWLIVYDTWSATPFTAIAVPINHIGLLLFLEP